jgi:hypothetical protein
MTTATRYYRLGIGVAVATALFLLFGIAALGIVGDGGPPDLMYVGALVVAIVGAVAVRFRARGMVVALGTAAVATVVAGVVAIAAGWYEDGGGSMVDVLGISAMYAGLFAVAALLFWRASTTRR